MNIDERIAQRPRLSLADEQRAREADPDSPPAPRTIRQYLSDLPAGYAERALANARASAILQPERVKLDDEAPTAALALKSGFEWTQTGEGRHFWGAVWQALDLRAELPEFDVLARKHLDLATMHRPYCPCIHCDRHREAIAGK